MMPICFFRVAITPAIVAKLKKTGFNVNVEENAGAGARFSNQLYEEAGATITDINKAFQSGRFLMH